MLRAVRVIAPAGHRSAPVVDTVILDFDQRNANGAVVTSAKGLAYKIDLPEARRLRTDDLLQLDDGSLIEVVAASEPLLEARAPDVSALARLAWHLGDRHIAAQLLPNRVRVKRGDAVEALLKALGAKLTMIDAPFEPEGGAYESAQAHSHHHHDHEHGRHHGHDHDHAHGHGRHHHD